MTHFRSNRSTQITDELLVLECQRGDPRALDRLVERWNKRLLVHAFRLVGEQEGAKEVVQEAWLAVVRGVQKLQDPSRFRPWVFQIVTHKAADFVRKAQLQRRSEAELRARAESSAALDNAERKDDDDTMQRALARLPPDSRAILALLYIEEMSVVEIAQVLGVPAGTVKSRLHSAREQLKETIERIKS